jgi:Spy/CpxP family protein refolding chaperone
MKKKYVCTLGRCLTTALLLVAAAAFLLPANGRAGEVGGVGRPFAAPLQRIMEQLKLTPEQRSAIQPIIQAVRAKHRALMEKNRGEGHEGNAGLRNEMQAIRKEAESQLAKILTSEQMAQYSKLRDEFMRSVRAAKGRCRDGRSGQGPSQQGS